jgi:hypothetical protein
MSIWTSRASRTWAPDGEPTGIQLPYIVTIDEGSSQVLSIRRNFDEGSDLARKRHYFVHYKFMPGSRFLRLWPDPHDRRPWPRLDQHPAATY